jgi:hypothetical protein
LPLRLRPRPHRIEGLRAALGENADDGDKSLSRPRPKPDSADWPDGVDLADLTERLQMPGQFRPPHRNPDPVIALAERGPHFAPQNPIRRKP